MANPQIKFVSITTDEIDAWGRTKRWANFTVDGVAVSRCIPETFEGTINDYLTALANGLRIEYQAEQKTIKPLDDLAFTAGEVVMEIPNDTL